MAGEKTLFLTVCLNPVLQKTIILDDLKENQVNRSREYYFDIAGKGIHVSRVLTQLGQKVIHLTQLGGIFKKAFLHLAKKEGFRLIYSESKADIRFCCTLVNRKTNSSTEIVEQGETVGEKTEKQIHAKFLKYLKYCQVLIISGSKAPGFSDRIFPSMVRQAKEAGKLVILDYREQDLLNSLQYSPNFIKPNSKEFLATFFPGIKANKRILRGKVKQKILKLNQQYGINVILTDGPGEIIYNIGQQIKTFKPQTIKPLNTIGCGDAFTAGFIENYLRTKDIEKCIIQGAECARKNALNIRPGVIG